MSPKNLTYMADDGEENLSTTLLCIADNAYQIDWIVNDSKMNGDHQHMYQSTVVSSFQFDISVGVSVEVVCRAWPSDGSNHVDSVPAVISFQSKFNNGTGSVWLCMCAWGGGGKGQFGVVVDVLGSQS